MIPKFIVEVKEGRVQWTEKLTDLWMYNLKNLGDGTYEMIIRKPRKPKSDKQRKYYWGCMMKLVADETGMNPLEVHAYCKQAHLPFDKDSTEELSTLEEEDYHERIRVDFLTNFNIKIPLPNEVEY